MKNKLIIAVFSLLVFVASAFTLTACDDTPQSEELFDGVFVLADSSSTEEQATDWVAVICDKVTLKQGEKMQHFSIKKDGSGYSADSSDKEIFLRLTGERMSVEADGKNIEYVLDKGYTYIQDSQPLSIPVSEPSIGGEDGAQYVGFSGAVAYDELRVQVKKAGEESYSDYAVKGEEIKVAAADLKAGDNFVRLYNAGGYPNVDENKNLFLQSDSQAIEYKISVDDQGNIVDVQNEIVLGNGVYQFAYSEQLLTLQEQECCNFVVIDSVMRRDYQGGSKLYYLSEENGVYSARSDSVNGSVGITFTVKNGILSAKIASSGRVYQLKKNDEYTYSQESKKLDTPSALKGEIAEGGKYVYFSIGAGDLNVSIGLRVEIKKAGESAYGYDSTATRYNDRIQTDNLTADDFAVGENYIRICNAGSPGWNSQNSYYMSEDSDYVEYKITLDENNTLTNLVRL